MTTDLRNTPISTSNPQTLALLEEATRQFQSYVGDATATLDRALAEEPDFVLGHLFKAAALACFGERRFTELGRASLDTAKSLLARAGNDPARVRERGLLAALSLLADGDWTAACAAFDRVLVEFPRDVIALQTAHIYDFVRGDAKNLRDRVTRVLPSWSASMPGYSYVLGYRAFGLEESNQYDEAQASAERALALEPNDAWSVHAIVHCLEMRGRTGDGIRFLADREADWAAPANGFAFHNWWHLALFELEQGNVDRVLELHDARIYPEPTDIALHMVDSTALLWRLYLRGHDVRARMERVADVWQTKLDGERGFWAFNDVHAMMAFAATGRHDLIARVGRDLEAPTTGSNAMMAREIGIPVARALAHFANERYERSIDDLLHVRDIANRFGGSHAQRDLLTLTLIEAARRAGQHALARHFTNERMVPRGQ